MADNPYTTQTLAGYNATPPPDDGSQVASNRVEWQKHLDKIGDPLKTQTAGINTQCLNAFQSVADLGENINAAQHIAARVFGMRLQWR